jgi:hypothetical protein
MNAPAWVNGWTVSFALLLLAWIIVGLLFWRKERFLRRVMAMPSHQLYALGRWNMMNEPLNEYAVEFDARRRDTMTVNGIMKKMQWDDH